MGGAGKLRDWPISDCPFIGKKIEIAAGPLLPKVCPDAANAACQPSTNSGPCGALSPDPIAEVGDKNDRRAMTLLLPLLLAASPALSDHPRTYLLSVANVPLKAGESIERFKFATWGVEFKAICHIPLGWRIAAGSSATPEGSLEGNGSQGATWFASPSPQELRYFALVTLYSAPQRADVRSRDGSGIVPATFKGQATISTDMGERQVHLTYAHVLLTPAKACKP